ncbi:MAG: hypothetical protein EOM92_21580 [Gammaproteobacteria bacterium]|nr:hypothetical protein [Gammaproteobacteria bacterium]
MNRWHERLRSHAATFVHDLAIPPLSWRLPSWFRFNLGAIPKAPVRLALRALSVLLIAQVVVKGLFRLCRDIWLLASLQDLVGITMAVLAGTAQTPNHLVLERAHDDRDVALAAGEEETLGSILWQLPLSTSKAIRA